MSGDYDDILHLPRHVSSTRPRMPIANRAAQFSPFAALTGYDAAIAETARRTDRRIEPGESDIAELDRKLGILAGKIAERPVIAVTYFQPDEKKEGGAYITASGTLKKIDDPARLLILSSGEKIPIGDILDIESDLFAAF